MHKKVSLRFVLAAFLCLVILHIGLTAESEQKKAMTFQDVMKFKEIHSSIISEDGAWLAYSAQPDRGDGEVQVQCIKTGKVFAVERGSKPVISKDSCWVVINIKPETVELEKSGTKKPKQGMAILETKTGKIKQFEKVERFALSNDSKWLAFCHFKEEKADKEESAKEAGEKPESAKENKKAEEEEVDLFSFDRILAKKEDVLIYTRESYEEFPELYIENSPVFFATRIQTPLLIMFGDNDGAVPWYQGIELYLAMRRLGKDCIFLQYRGEPHHLQKYPNKLDYSIRMKEYFDHYLKGKPAPEWIKKGVPYRGK